MASSPETSQGPRWYHSVWFVLAMLFFVMGPLALPLLWKSPRFPGWAKAALTVLMVGVVLWIAQAIPAVLSSILRDMAQLKSVLP